MSNIQNECNTEIANLRHDHWAAKCSLGQRGQTKTDGEEKILVNCKIIKNECEELCVNHQTFSLQHHCFIELQPVLPTHVQGKLLKEGRVVAK